MLLKLASMTSSGLNLETRPFNCCIREAFSVLGIRTPNMSMLLYLNDVAVCSTVEVSILSPFSFCAFPSENITRILNIAEDLLNKDEN